MYIIIPDIKAEQSSAILEPGYQYGSLLHKNIENLYKKKPRL